MLFQRLNSEELAFRLAAIVDSSEDAVIGTDEHGAINTWNAAASRLFLYRPEEIIGQSILVLVPPDLHEEQCQHFRQVLQGRRIQHYETTRIAKGGRRLDLSLTISPIQTDDGRTVGSAVIARDVSSRQLEHAALARLAAVVESSDDAVIAKDLNGVITDWNAGAERIFGYSKEEMVGRSILTIIPPDLQHEEPLILGKIRSGERVEHHVTQRLHKSGRRLDISLTTSPIRDASGRVIGASKIARDITPQRQSESVRQMLAAIVESSDDAIISKNLDGIITSWNAGAERVFGYKPEEIIGHSVMRLIPRDYQWEEAIIIAKLRRGERIEHQETKRMRKNGEIIDVSLTISPMRDSSGRVIGASKIARDITERKATETLLMEREKLAAIARMSATLAHEVNNPLESIMNLSYLLSEDPSLTPEAKELARLLVKEVQRAGEITRQTLTYYREPRVSGDVDVVASIQHVLAAKRKKLDSKQITVRDEFGPRTVRGFAGELRQVFENLIDNAIEASRPGGIIRLRTRKSALDGDENLVVTVSDNGSGITPEVMERMFQPFFTTKLRKGCGLGLWVCQGIVQKHGGRIRIRSCAKGPKSGSVFRVTLPAPKRAAAEPLKAARTPKAV